MAIGDYKRMVQDVKDIHGELSLLSYIGRYVHDNSSEVYKSLLINIYDTIDKSLDRICQQTPLADAWDWDQEFFNHVLESSQDDLYKTVVAGTVFYPDWDWYMDIGQDFIGFPLNGLSNLYDVLYAWYGY